MPNTDNGRVTLAVLGEKVDNLDAIIREYCQTSYNNHEDHEKRVRTLEKQATTNDVQHKYRMWGQGVFTVALTAFRTKISEITGLG